ncbi:thioesterase family protein [Dactylosporangium sp. NBC_01737]|uniref:thioesterase family protein n=1 Tax=Dactylosporangium sp. NBC_01737 TaxID=2975959 RepID=UPI002E1624D8|nr:thioesterase family protein [Dactylosporangium sp. NBC_01737]
MAGFTDATSVQRADDDSFDTDLDPLWTVGGKPNGGYLLAILARAAIETAGTHPDPLSASAVYLSPPDPGPAAVTVEVLRAGRSASQVRARLSQKDRTCVEALFTLGALAAAGEPRWVDAAPPPVAAEDALFATPSQAPGTGLRIDMLDQFEQRIDWQAVGDPPGELRGWLRLPDGAAWDPVSLLFAADAFPPATFTLGSNGWTPTLELTVYVRALPAPGPLRVRQRARLLTESLVDQVCEIWDAEDRIVAQATQLAAYRMPAS